MNRLFSVVSVALLVGISLASVHSASADSRRVEVFRAWLSGFNEVFATGNGTLSSPGRGFFRAVIDEDAGTIEYSLTYSGIPTAVQQSHLHLGATHTAGGISVFLCTNLGNGPAGTQACPQESGRITGTIAAVDVIGPTGQGIAAGEFEELLAAIRNGVVYANLHTMQYPGGEIRGQLQR
jgi:CHRD domain-containing protein